KQIPDGLAVWRLRGRVRAGGEQLPNSFSGAGHRCLHEGRSVEVVAGVHDSAVTCEKRDAIGVVLYGKKVEGCFAKTVVGVDEFRMLAQEPLRRWLIENRSIHEFVEKRIV